MKTLIFHTFFSGENASFLHRSKLRLKEHNYVIMSHRISVKFVKNTEPVI